jgi:hypothetical protein
LQPQNRRRCIQRLQDDVFVRGVWGWGRRQLTGRTS